MLIETVQPDGMLTAVEMAMVMDEVVEVAYSPVEGIEVLTEGMMSATELATEAVSVATEKTEAIRSSGTVEVTFAACMSEINNCRNRVRRTELTP